jgi:hypothetical protein
MLPPSKLENVVLPPASKYQASVEGDDKEPEKAGNEPKLKDRFFNMAAGPGLLVTIQLQRNHDP